MPTVVVNNTAIAYREATQRGVQFKILKPLRGGACVEITGDEAAVADLLHLWNTLNRNVIGALYDDDTA